MTSTQVPTLAGLTVLEIDGGEAGAIAGMTLADHGAAVTKIEPPEGAPERRRSGSENWDRGKSSVVVDASGPAAVATLAGLLSTVDVVIEGQGSLAALLDQADELAGDGSRRIRCSIDGFGAHGPLAGLPARDLLVAAHLGSCADQSGWSPGPSYPVHHVASVGAGLLAVQGILAALLVRARDGHGQRVATSLLAAGLAMSGRVEAGTPFRDRGLSARARGTSPLYSVYECGDGRWIQFGCLHGGFVERAVATLGISAAIEPLRSIPGFGDGVAPSPESIRAPFYAAVEGAVRSRPRAEWLALLEAADVPVAPVLDSEAFFDDAQGQANGFGLVDDPQLGAVELLGPALRLSDTPAFIRAGRPDLGEAQPALESPGPAPRNRADRTVPGAPPLDGLVVIEIANVIAGPMTGRYLADLGATVIKVESPEGDIFRQQNVPEFHPLNAGKLGLAIDLKASAGRDTALGLVERADVLVNNLRPGAAERLGLGDAAARERNPNLVYCQVSAFGSAGPYSLRAGGDPLAGAYTGMQATQGGSANPVYVRGAPIDYTAALVATAGILLGLLARDRIGHGQRVDTSLLDAGALLNAAGLARYAGRPERDDRSASQYRHDSLVGLYEVADGWLALDVETEPEWTALVGALNEPSLAADPRFADRAARATNDAALTELIGRRLRAGPLSATVQALLNAGVPAAPVRSVQALTLQDPAIADNGWVTEVIDPALGPIRLAHNWLSLSVSGSGPRSAAPQLGGDGERVLAELGSRR